MFTADEQLTGIGAERRGMSRRTTVTDSDSFVAVSDLLKHRR